MGELSEGRRAGVAKVRRSRLRLPLRGSWGSTPARSCSQRWRSLAVGQTRRTEGSAGDVQAGPWDWLEPGRVLGSKFGDLFQEAGSGTPGWQGPGQPGAESRGFWAIGVHFADPIPHLMQPLQAWLRHPTWSHRTCFTEGRLRLLPPLHRNTPPLWGTERGAEGENRQARPRIL